MVIGRVKELLGASSRGVDRVPTPGRPASRRLPWRRRPRTKPKSIDDYFDQLDAAFSNLSGKPARPAGPVAPPEIDWFGLKHGSSASMAEPELAMDQAVASPRPNPYGPGPFRRCPRVRPPQADEFAALLEVEQARPPTATPEPSPAPVAAVPAAEIPRRKLHDGCPCGGRPRPAPAAAPVAVTDDLVAQVSARVLLQLTDRVVRETVAEIAERLIREEIERIKASIQ